MAASPFFSKAVLAPIVCTLLSIQSSAFVLLRAYMHDDTCNETVLMYNEVLKLVVSACVILSTTGSLANVLDNSQAALFPVIAYAIMNLLSFWALQHLAATVSVVIIQLKLLFTAFFSRTILDTEVPLARKAALVALLLGVLGIVLAPQAGDDALFDGSSTQIVAAAALTLETMMSGITSVYMQHLFSDQRSVWSRNFQLAMLSVPVYLFRATTQGCSLSLVTAAGWTLAVVSALGGILVALSTLYAGAIGKAVSSTAAIALTVVLEHLLILRWPTADETVPVLAVLNAVTQYSFCGKPAAPKPTAPAVSTVDSTPTTPTTFDITADKPTPLGRGHGAGMRGVFSYAMLDEAAEAAPVVAAPPPPPPTRPNNAKVVRRLIIAIASLCTATALVVSSATATACGGAAVAAVAAAAAAAEAATTAEATTLVIDVYDLREPWHFEQQERLFNYISSYVAQGAGDGALPIGGEVRWRSHLVPAADFLIEGGGVSQAAAGSVVLLGSHSLTDPSLRMHEMFDRDRVRRSKRIWALLNASNPLVIFLDNDADCSLEDLAPILDDTHHVVYRNTWSRQLHATWAAQQARASPPNWPASLRSFPYGTSYGQAGSFGKLDELSAPSPPADERPLLFSVRGTLAYNKPSRALLQSAEAAAHADWQATAERLMRPSRAAANPSYGRYIVDLVEVDAEYRTASYDYLAMLRGSIFSLSPPGDVWEAYRTYEAVEAGSIPVVVNNATYKTGGGCTLPAAHMLATMPFVVSVESWDELPLVLERVMSNMSAVVARQKQMRDWLAADKSSFRRDLLGLVRGMQAASWRPPTKCAITPLAPGTVGAQQVKQAEYWRRPQPYQVSEWTPNSVGPTTPARSFVGEGGWCADGVDDFAEECMTAGCGAPIIDSLDCAPVDGAAAEVAGPPEESPLCALWSR